uniref:Uncharacterized protein n=1 Tax=Chromera velia CCMP2878 TaxID=1169474 RepID=A0A0G4HKM5_9ALVE|eukprot:Cvel_7264.t1-p1 / transcript=Cvel_7264.t1 / gene=Cvel_7264 / organism=Chromera_velia_CCMP2878 / gene_product=hypothetical protein / transcript_product=hypothetical protein / location=Cvel_scaffold375:45855-52792(+) / protein_length=1480 / sequence_SO=supercontig / SO=protein_coding / is_pseudo=false
MEPKDTFTGEDVLEELRQKLETVFKSFMDNRWDFVADLYKDSPSVLDQQPKAAEEKNTDKSDERKSGELSQDLHTLTISKASLLTNLRPWLRRLPRSLEVVQKSYDAFIDGHKEENKRKAHGTDPPKASRVDVLKAVQQLISAELGDDQGNAGPDSTKQKRGDDGKGVSLMFNGCSVVAIRDVTSMLTALCCLSDNLECFCTSNEIEFPLFNILSTFNLNLRELRLGNTIFLNQVDKVAFNAHLHRVSKLKLLRLFQAPRAVACDALLTSLSECRLLEEVELWEDLDLEFRSDRYKTLGERMMVTAAPLQSVLSNCRFLKRFHIRPIRLPRGSALDGLDLRVQPEASSGSGGVQVVGQRGQEEQGEGESPPSPLSCLEEATLPLSIQTATEFAKVLPKLNKLWRSFDRAPFDLRRIRRHLEGKTNNVQDLDATNATLSPALSEWFTGRNSGNAGMLPKGYRTPSKQEDDEMQALLADWAFGRESDTDAWNEDSGGVKRCWIPGIGAAKQRRTSSWVACVYDPSQKDIISGQCLPVALVRTGARTARRKVWVSKSTDFDVSDAAHGRLPIPELQYVYCPTRYAAKFPDLSSMGLKQTVLLAAFFLSPHATSRTRLQVFAHPKAVVSEKEAAHVQFIAQRRFTGFLCRPPPQDSQDKARRRKEKESREKEKQHKAQMPPPTQQPEEGGNGNANAPTFPFSTPPPLPSTTDSTTNPKNVFAPLTTPAVPPAPAVPIFAPPSNSLPGGEKKEGVGIFGESAASAATVFSLPSSTPAVVAPVPGGSLFGPGLPPLPGTDTTASTEAQSAKTGGDAWGGLFGPPPSTSASSSSSSTAAVPPSASIFGTSSDVFSFGGSSSSSSAVTPSPEQTTSASTAAAAAAQASPPSSADAQAAEKENDKPPTSNPNPTLFAVPFSGRPSSAHSSSRRVPGSSGGRRPAGGGRRTAASSKTTTPSVAAPAIVVTSEGVQKEKDEGQDRKEATVSDNNDKQTEDRQQIAEATAPTLSPALSPPSGSATTPPPLQTHTPPPTETERSPAATAADQEAASASSPSVAANREVQQPVTVTAEEKLSQAAHPSPDGEAEGGAATLGVGVAGHTTAETQAAPAVPEAPLVPSEAAQQSEPPLPSGGTANAAEGGEDHQAAAGDAEEGAAEAAGDEEGAEEIVEASAASPIGSATSAPVAAVLAAASAPKQDAPIFRPDPNWKLTSNFGAARLVKAPPREDRSVWPYAGRGGDACSTAVRALEIVSEYIEGLEWAGDIVSKPVILIPGGGSKKRHTFRFSQGGGAGLPGMGAAGSDAKWGGGGAEKGDTEDVLKNEPGVLGFSSADHANHYFQIYRSPDTGLRLRVWDVRAFSGVRLGTLKKLVPEGMVARLLDIVQLNTGNQVRSQRPQYAEFWLGWGESASFETREEARAVRATKERKAKEKDSRFGGPRRASDSPKDCDACSDSSNKTSPEDCVLRIDGKGTVVRDEAAAKFVDLEDN